jgi:hypothetical protein
LFAKLAGANIAPQQIHIPIKQLGGGRPKQPSEEEGVAAVADMSSLQMKRPKTMNQPTGNRPDRTRARKTARSIRFYSPYKRKKLQPF